MCALFLSSTTLDVLYVAVFVVVITSCVSPERRELKTLFMMGQLDDGVRRGRQSTAKLMGRDKRQSLMTWMMQHTHCSVLVKCVVVWCWRWLLYSGSPNSCCCFIILLWWSTRCHVITGGFAAAAMILSTFPLHDYPMSDSYVQYVTPRYRRYLQYPF